MFAIDPEKTHIPRIGHARLDVIRFIRVIYTIVYTRYIIISPTSVCSRRRFVSIYSAD